MINEIYPHIFKNEYLNVQPNNNDIALIFDTDKIFVKDKANIISFPTIEDIKSSNILFDYTFLFRIDEINYFLINPKASIVLEDYSFQSIYIFRKSSPKYLSFAGITGYQLYSWYNKNKYCGKCGAKMYHSKTSRTMICPKCEDTRYPFLAPAVIVGVIDGNKILVTRYAKRKLSNYALIAGYAEIGENIEQTVQREVMEEVGLKVKNIEYYKSQPWSFSGALLFGFFCELDGSNKVILDEEELSMAKWISREEIDDEDEPISLTGEMIQYFKKTMCNP